LRTFQVLNSNFDGGSQSNLLFLLILRCQQHSWAFPTINFLERTSRFSTIKR
jgi:hypothetical protein